MSDFVHLHCHTEFSLLDGAIRIKDLCNQAVDYGMPAVAMTDHGNLYGAISFYKQAKKVGIKPIIGCEVYVCPDHLDKTPERGRERYHLVLLAQNLLGYHNLAKIVSLGAMEGFYHKPRVDKKILADHSEGIIALSACLTGEIPRAILRKGMDAAFELCNEYKTIFPGRFFLELQVNGLQEQNLVNPKLMELAEKTAIPIIGTNDCHYLRKDDVEAHDILLCIQTQASVNDEKRMRFDTHELYYKSPEEMEKDFSWAPEALANSMRIVEMCEDYNFELGVAHFPRYELPEGVSLDDEFRALSRDGLEKRLAAVDYPAKREDYFSRLELELDVIANMGYQGYFLIVQDFINWAKNHGVPVGPGRGSAAGSIVAWALRITNLDPIPYNLLFERFLNPERVSLPDIDVDFCERKRHEVIEYVSRKYGEDSVAQITTFGTMKAKGVVRDVGRALGMNFKETDTIAKLIPNDLKMTIDLAMQTEPELATLYESDPQIKKLIDVSRRLEGLARHASTHAAGVVISDKPMVEYLPLYRGKRSEIVTQYDKNIVEEVGLVKFDFLGLKTMTLIQDALDLIARQGKPVPDLDTMSLDDPEVYRVLSAGDTDGIFQVESTGMRKYLRKLRPSVFEDIVAMLALYRPGPLGANMVDDFINRKHGISEITYPLPSLENCLKDTYGVIVYQEQVMQIAQVVANYTLGGADMLRRAMGKKDASKMAAERAKFVQGAEANDVSSEKASEIFDLMEKFAEYGFNKSHSAAYALISYHTAYLKAHYKAEFMAALMTSEMGNQDKLLKYVATCKDMGLEVVPPSVQESISSFSVREGRVVFGLGGIKNVGGEAIREIVEAREKDGEFASLLDLCSRVNLRKVTKRVLENLIKGGACDCLGCTRAALLASLELVVSRAQKKQKDKVSDQNSLLSLMGAAPERKLSGIGVDCPEAELGELSNDVKMGFEKDALGFFLTSHPLQPYRRDMQRMEFYTLEECPETSPMLKIRCGVLVNGVREIFTKKGDRMAFLQVGDLTGSGECVFFPRDYAVYRDVLNAGQPIELVCRVQRDRGDANKAEEDENAEENVVKEIKLEGISARPLLDAVQSSEAPLVLDFTVEEFRPEFVASLKNILLSHKGRVAVNIALYGEGFRCILDMPSAYKVNPGPELSATIADWELKMKRAQKDQQTQQ